ncbi:MAG: hypothetical protein J2P28_02575 [Actinobacteria bacterium]|nr:hypothetical protein [Actinomycetota bacterium]MBO0834388.1 hypothetical protein [Actinomycetota bacterium]
MPSWRDSASEQCQNDLDGLLNITLPFAQQMLKKSGEFYPFGAAMSTEGEAQLLGAHPGPDRPATAEVLALLLKGFRHDRGRFRAVAICSDVRLSDSDAVRVELEHQEGSAMAVFLPYQKNHPGNDINYGELRAETAERQVWI